MIAGHFGLAAAVKSRAPRAPLWALMLATVWLDIVFVPLFLTGIETAQPAEPGLSGYGALVIHAGYTHSFIGMLLLSALLGGLASLPWGRGTGLVVGLVAASHWLLDLITHRADLPLLPGPASSLPGLGLGLWRFPLATCAVELVLVLAGAWLYWRAAQQAAQAAGHGLNAAKLAAALIAFFGVLVLGLDFAGM